MSRWRNPLTGVACFGAVITFGGASYFSVKIQNNFKKQPYFKKTLDLFYGYKPGVNLLGPPIKIEYLNLNKKGENFASETISKLTIPLKGTRQSGALTSWASRKDAEDEWKIDKIDMTVEETQWTFYLHPTSKHLYSKTQTNSSNENIDIGNDTDSESILENNVTNETEEKPTEGEKTWRPLSDVIFNRSK